MNINIIIQLIDVYELSEVFLEDGRYTLYTIEHRLSFAYCSPLRGSLLISLIE